MVEVPGDEHDVSMRPEGGPPRRARRIAVPVGGVVVVALTIAVALSTGWMAGVPSTANGSPVRAHHATPAIKTAASAAAAPPVTTPTTEAPAPAISAPTPESTIAALVSQVEGAGIVPGSGWSWSHDDAAAPCGMTTAVGGSVGCTSWSSGVVRTVFAGTPDLALVAHEVANAETEQFAPPSLLQQVSTAEAGSSWSPTDAVASCLVLRFLGFQDGVAGSWQCPAALATSVALHLHDVVGTTTTTAQCGTTSGVSSTLTFAPSGGTLTVTAPSGAVPPVTTGTVPVTVSGIGTFTATDVGGTATVIGTCEA